MRHKTKPNLWLSQAVVILCSCNRQHLTYTEYSFVNSFMKVIFSILVFLSFQLTVKPQSKLFGKYKFFPESEGSGSLILNCNYSFRLEDKLFYNKDSLITSTVLGIWKIRKNGMLVLIVDVIISDFEPVGNLKKLSYYITEGKLQLKLQTEVQYYRQKRKFDRKFKNIKDGKPVDYETYKLRQKRCYFRRIQDFDCL